VTTSGTYVFSPGLGEITLYALNLIGVRNTAVLQEHMESARMAANMVLGRWSSLGVNLWAVDLVTTPLVEGTATYAVDANTITMLDAYITVTSGGATTNRLIMPISRSEYASYAQPQQQGAPTVFWFDRLLSPTVTLWPVPDGNQTSLNYYRMRQIQDSNFTNGQTVEVPIYWLEAFAYALAQRLALQWAPERAKAMKELADESYDIAATQNIETSQIFISPMLGSYYRP